ncbi:alkyl hydroperoxide reductase [Pradoshia eiseniae]|uniref:Alkyl hydroperoxide reductase n=1 Tax=Pradoshia eiseniae TaxID=2064768 RepID=A0A2S7MXH6_9BACI|nr:redoxin domain-containing protein [Pradoshia eiseniae]PQD94479.1 alkyl hydroperoxide reductase [Pradoshia eiseniae]
MKKIFGILLLFGLIGAAFYQILNQDEKPAGAKVGGPAADFTLEDLEGNKVSLSDYEGKKVFLNFWATWCEPCKEEMPEMEKIHKNYKDVVILAINLDTHKDIQGFMDEHGLTFGTLLDVEEEVNDQYEVVSIPTSFFIDEEGIIRKKIVGVLDYEKMEENIEAL